MEKVFIEVPLMGEYLTTVRLTTGGICALAGFDVDETEDFKVCVTESLLILKRNGYTRAKICFSVDQALGCTITGEAYNGVKENTLEDEISRALLSALLGDVQFVNNANGEVESIVFEG